MPKPQFTSGADFNNQKLTGLADGTAATDAVTLQQMQAAIRGLSWKDEVVAASTANVNLASPGASLDGVTLSNPSRILLKNQTIASQNGIYDWTGSAVALTRSVDADSSAELNGATVTVLKGTTNADTVWIQTTDDPTVDTTSLAFVQLGGSGGFTVAGAGLTSTGSTVDVGAGTGIVANANDVAIDTTVVPRYANTQSAAATSTTLTHNWNTRKVIVEVVKTSDGTRVFPDVTVNLNTIVVTFPAAVGAGDYEITAMRAS